MTSDKSAPEAKRLEELWHGQFGDDYVERNRAAGNVRAPFWTALLQEIHPRRALEVGCNVGANLRWVADQIGSENTWGLDINLKALEEVRRSFGRINAIWSPARELPFRDGFFDLVFTMGVLIHQPDATLPLVMAEIVRCSRRWVLCGEYFAESTTEVPYRQQPGALFKRDYGLLYQELFPELRLIRRDFLSKDQGWDDVTVWLFEKE